ncbi:hypothetical protein GCM10023320_49340 [Pseudonocardia adelaidensis]|uniref:Uncharacterized protein n=2 Tax=Pseudonocardia adelaidensis TaxID=648754 RepID=A0ABP9NQV4_9PSEU
MASRSDTITASVGASPNRSAASGSPDPEHPAWNAEKLNAEARNKVLITQRRAMGTGYVVADEWVVTARQVVEDLVDGEPVLAKGLAAQWHRVRAARVVGWDELGIWPSKKLEAFRYRGQLGEAPPDVAVLHVPGLRRPGDRGESGSPACSRVSRPPTSLVATRAGLVHRTAAPGVAQVSPAVGRSRRARPGLCS